MEYLGPRYVPQRARPNWRYVKKKRPFNLVAFGRLTALLEPETWTKDEKRRWLAAVSKCFFQSVANSIEEFDTT